jgi:hypothetical protein
MKLINSILIFLLVGLLQACNYLDIVPDNIPTIEMAFSDRQSAEKYLFTCYSYVPAAGSPIANPALTGGDEIWFLYPLTSEQFNWQTNFDNINIARGLQNVNSPLANYFDGGMFIAIRDCNTFLESIDQVKDITDFEKKRWVAEVKFLKAYYHYYLLQLYGPVPIIKENLPVSSDPGQVKVFREPFDDCVAYIAQLLDEAVIDLPEKIQLKNTELGRITKVIALSLKAKLLTLAASPLFNGNSDFSGTVDKQGRTLFCDTYDPDKWGKAAVAIKAAIDEAEKAGNKLYYFTEPVDISDSTRVKMNIRNSVCDPWNEELIWGSVKDPYTIQSLCQGKLKATDKSSQTIRCNYSPTMEVAETFYTEHGVPIDEDKDWDYEGRYGTRKATSDDRYYIKEGYETAKLHFNREPRFYASVGFDGGIWYGHGVLDDDDPDIGYLKQKNSADQWGMRIGFGWFSITGYLAKKVVNYNNIVPESWNSYSVENYPFPIIRLADLYLLYAEALNESGAPLSEIDDWIDVVRARAGLKGVVESWTNYSKTPDKVTTREGMRKIIQQERLIEFAFEGERFWDLRRWKLLQKYSNKPVRGWNVEGATTNDYYVPTVIFQREFTYKDYLWPISENDLIVNDNLVQNPGW